MKEGDPFPHFTGEDLMTGKPLDTKAMLDGKSVLLVDFWAMNCVSCIEEMPHIVDMYKRLKDRGLRVLGVEMDLSAKRAKMFLEKLGFEVPYPNILDNKAQIKAKLGVAMLPTNILVDSSGVVRLFHVGYKKGFEKELEEHVVKLLPGK